MHLLAFLTGTDLFGGIDPETPPPSEGNLLIELSRFLAASEQTSRYLCFYNYYLTRPGQLSAVYSIQPVSRILKQFYSRGNFMVVVMVK